MVVAESTLSKTWITNRIKVTALFLLSGLLSGWTSGWLSSTPRLRNFLYIKGDKFLIPTYKFWTVFALVFSGPRNKSLDARGGSASLSQRGTARLFFGADGNEIQRF